MKPSYIELPDGTRVEILHEDRSVIAIDKPPGWMLAPESWNKTSRNLHRELMLSVQARDFWARSRNLRYIRFIHRLDADTSGIVLLARNQGVLRVMSRLFETRSVQKKYLAVVRGIPSQTRWTCRLKILSEPDSDGRIQINARNGKESETTFTVLAKGKAATLVEAAPLTGRTHQIRVHLAAAGHPVLGDELYGEKGPSLALRAVELCYTDPFQRRAVRIAAPTKDFLRQSERFLAKTTV